ncbi:MAG: hypothetical protein Q9174_006679 [Haloplaca sp. 1 TL-2023]
MLEEEERKARQKQFEIDQETERLKRQYGKEQKQALKQSSLPPPPPGRPNVIPQPNFAGLHHPQPPVQRPHSASPYGPYMQRPGHNNASDKIHAPSGRMSSTYIQYMIIAFASFSPKNGALRVSSPMFCATQSHHTAGPSLLVVFHGQKIGTISSAFTLAILFSYLPQYHRIISRGSSHGISPYFILLSTVFTTSALANTLLLQSADGGYDCCKSSNSIHGSECFTSLAATVQAALHWLASTILFIVYLIFYPRPTPKATPSPKKRHSLSSSTLALSPERRRALASQPYPLFPKLIALAALIIGILILTPTLAIILSPSIASKAPQTLKQDWSFFASTLSLAAATIQFLPQLYTTLRLKSHQSLSMVTLGLQSILLLLLGIYRIRDLSPQDDGKYWLHWLRNGSEIAAMDYIVSAAVEALLLALCLYLYFVRPRLVDGGLDGDDEAEEEYISGIGAGEETPLLGKGSGKQGRGHGSQSGDTGVRTSEQSGSEMGTLGRCREEGFSCI